METKMLGNLKNLKKLEKLKPNVLLQANRAIGFNFSNFFKFFKFPKRLRLLYQILLILYYIYACRQVIQGFAHSYLRAH